MTSPFVVRISYQICSLIREKERKSFFFCCTAFKNIISSKIFATREKTAIKRTHRKENGRVKYTQLLIHYLVYGLAAEKDNEVLFFHSDENSLNNFRPRRVVVKLFSEI